MKIDSWMNDGLDGAGAQAAFLEDCGFDGIMTAETTNDPFLPLTLAAEHTSRTELITAIAVAFARNPMSLAHLGHDLNAFSKGRFVLGLGSQIRPHIQRRFSMTWSRPAARMKEMVQALHAIWDCWYDGKPLEFRGEFYTHTLMTPAFSPDNIRYGRPKTMLAAVGPRMTEAAAAVTDGIILHPFTTERYIREFTLPIIEETLNKEGRARRDFEIAHAPFVVSGANEEAFNASRQAVQGQIAFYASTPAYKGVLDIHGWGDLQPELNRLSKLGRWDDMGALIDPDILKAFAVMGEPADVAAQIKARYGPLVDRMSVSLGDDKATVTALIQNLKAAP